MFTTKIEEKEKKRTMLVQDELSYEKINVNLFLGRD